MKTLTGLSAAVLTLLMQPCAVWAADENPAPATPLSRELVSPADIMQLLAGLGIVIAAILLVAWLVRRLGAGSVNNGKLRVVAGLALGQRERVVLVQVGDEHQVLLGVTPGQIRKLTEFDSPVIQAEAGGLQGEFAGRLRSALERQGKSGS